MVDYFYLLLYYTFSLLSKLLPKKSMDWFLKTLSNIAYRIDKKHRKIIYTNLDLAFGNTLNQSERDKIGIRTFYNMLHTIVGFMRRYGKSKEILLTNITFHRDDIVRKALENDQKIIFITGHYSNWELLAPALATKFNFTLAAVGRRLNSKLMNQILIKNRQQFGVEMIDRQGAMKGMIKALKENKPVGLLLDQSLYEHQGALKVDFFGKNAGHSPAASILGRMFNATVIPVFISTDDYEQYEVNFYDPLPIQHTDDKETDILQMTQAQANITQKVIEKKPEEWFWVHKRWKTFHPELYK